MRAATAIATDAERRVQAANVLLTRTVRVIGAIQDVSERKWAELALADQQRKLEQLVRERTAELASARDAAEAANRAKSNSWPI